MLHDTAFSHHAVIIVLQTNEHEDHLTIVSLKYDEPTSLPTHKRLTRRTTQTNLLSLPHPFLWVLPHLLTPFYFRCAPSSSSPHHPQPWLVSLPPAFIRSHQDVVTREQCLLYVVMRCCTLVGIIRKTVDVYNDNCTLCVLQNLREKQTRVCLHIKWTV